MRRITWVLYAARMQSSLPLFPLNTVLVPGLVMPLHIFEPRYRHMVASLLALTDEDDREFGIIGIREGRQVSTDGISAVYPVGCATVIRQSELFDDGRYDIVTTGSRRFRVLSLDSSQPLLSAQVEFLADDSDPADQALAVRAARSFRDYRVVLGGQISVTTPDEGDGDSESDSDGEADAYSDNDFGLYNGNDIDDDSDEGIPDDPTVLSYLITAAMVLPMDERQQLLAAASTAERLERARHLLRRECAIISAISALPSLEPLGPPPSPN